MELTQKQFASLGGVARSKKLSKKRRIEIARNAGKANRGKKKKVDKVVKSIV